MRKTDSAVSVDVCNSSDISDWLRMRRNLCGYMTLEEHEKRIYELLSDKGATSCVYIARIDGSVAGFIEVSLRATAIGCRTGGVGYIDNWYIEPLFRRIGLGRELVRVAEKWAVSKGCAEIATETEERYPISPVAAKSLGYTETDTPNHFIKSIKSI